MEPGFLIGPLDSGATHLFVTEALRGSVAFMDHTIVKRVRLANGQTDHHNGQWAH